MLSHVGNIAISDRSSSGSKSAEIRYYPWGTERYTSGTTPTTYHFTGQRLESGIGLYFYEARWYDPAAGRFVQADTIVPDPGNTQDWDRYSYAINNPLRYTDPSGHCSGDYTDPNNPDKPCWDLYFDIYGEYRTILNFLDSMFDLSELKIIQEALQMISNVFDNDLNSIYAAYGKFSIININFINGQMTPPGFNLVILSKNFKTEDVIHELGHIFDFEGTKGDSEKYKSQSFVNWFGNGCKPGWLGCVANDNLYCKWNIGGGCGDWQPEVNAKTGTSSYGARSSVDDFADSFVAYALIQNGREPGKYSVSSLRIMIVNLWVDQSTP